jgi:hypothetical protein
MREHRYHIDMPHPAARIWALMQDYDHWTRYAPMVLEVQVLWPGDAHGNGLLRRVIYQMPFGRRGAALELVLRRRARARLHVHDDRREPGNDQTGRVRLEPRADGTRLHFEERYHLTSAPWKWLEGRSTASSTARTKSRCAALRLAHAHPEYRPTSP